MVKLKQEKLNGMPPDSSLHKAAESLVESWERLQGAKDVVVKCKNKVLEEMKKVNKYKISIDDISIEFKESKEGVVIKREPNRE